MKEEITLIQHKWKNGTYQLTDMVQLVRDKVITKEEFFYITRFNFNGVVDTYSL